MNLPEKPTDRRVLRTKKNIRQAFLHLLSEKSLSQITVKELSDLADINRKTFYMYYSNIEDIFAELEDELVLKLVHVFEKELFQKEMFDSYSFFENLNRTIQEDIGLYRILNHSDLLPHLIQRAKNALIEVFFGSIIYRLIQTMSATSSMQSMPPLVSYPCTPNGSAVISICHWKS